MVLPDASAFPVVPGERSLLITRSDVTTRLIIERRVVSLLPLRHLSPRLSQARAARDRDERSVRATHAARPDLVTIQRAGWCLPPAARCVILQSGQTSPHPGVLAPEERSASASSRVLCSSILRALPAKTKPQVLEGLFPGVHHGTLLHLWVRLLESLQSGTKLEQQQTCFCSNDAEAIVKASAPFPPRVEGPGNALAALSQRMASSCCILHALAARFPCSDRHGTRKKRVRVDSRANREMAQRL